MDRHEEIGLDSSRLLHAHVQSNEIVVIASEHCAHARFPVDQAPELARNGQRDVFLVGAAPPDRARILASMPRVDCDDDLAPHFASGRWRSRLRRGRRSIGGARSGRVFACIGISLEQRHQRVRRRQWIEVENDAMGVIGKGLQCEDLRIHFGFEIEHDSHHTRLQRSHADRLNVGVVGMDQLRKLHQLKTHFDAVEIEQQPLRIAHGHPLKTQRSY